MNVKIDRSFEKDTNKIKDSKLLSQVATCIINIGKIEDIAKIKGIKKMKGAPFHYRIRIGDYRAGVVINENDVVFERFLHRKDIYKYFPRT